MFISRDDLSKIERLGILGKLLSDLAAKDIQNFVAQIKNKKWQDGQDLHGSQAELVTEKSKYGEEPQESSVARQ